MSQQPTENQKASSSSVTSYQPGIVELENSKIIRSIWKNTFDKILEIKISNKRELKEMKEKIMLEEKKKIDQTYSRKYNEEFTKKKIEVSTAKNKANLDKMNIKNELVQKTVDETLEKLKAFAKPENNSYKKLLKELILECMVKLLEKECFVKVRKDDLNYVQSIIKECESEFSKLMEKETKRHYECKLNILDDEFIEDEYGGVVLMSKDKKILINNGLKDRLFLTKEKHLPEIKKMLFPIVK